MLLQKLHAIYIYLKLHKPVLTFAVADMNDGVTHTVINRRAAYKKILQEASLLPLFLQIWHISPP